LWGIDEIDLISNGVIKSVPEPSFSGMRTGAAVGVPRNGGRRRGDRRSGDGETGVFEAEVALGVAEGDGFRSEAWSSGQGLQEFGGMEVVVALAVLTGLTIERRGLYLSDSGGRTGERAGGRNGSGRDDRVSLAAAQSEREAQKKRDAAHAPTRILGLLQKRQSRGKAWCCDKHLRSLLGSIQRQGGRRSTDSEQ
jgi:hypothetical protein